MFGWEFPPFFAGGVGMVCYELTKQLSEDGIDVQYVMPFCPEYVNPSFLKLHNAEKNFPELSFIDLPNMKNKINSLKITKISSLLAAYQTEEDYQECLKNINNCNGCKELTEELKQKLFLKNNTTTLYGQNMMEEIQLFALRVEKMYYQGLFDDFDVIHAHDWTTIPAAIRLKELSGKPLIIHVHITEFNKTGNNTANPDVYRIEKEGFDKADKIIAISNLIKDTVKKYGEYENKIEVVYNGGIKMSDPIPADTKSVLGRELSPDTKIVLYAGRVTGMKGPLRFIEMANLVLKHKPNTLFVMAGTGDQLMQCIKKTEELGINQKFHFFGFYNKHEAEMLYDLADVFVLPSQLEPFGVTPLEAMMKNSAVVLSKQSGVAEVIKNCLFNDFWDVEKMASNVISLLTYNALLRTMRKEAYLEAKQLDWKKPAKELVQIYRGLIA
jgi:glycogen synthase